MLTTTQSVRYAFDQADIDLAHADHLMRTLSTALDKEPHLLSQSHEALMEQFQKGLSVVAIDKDGQLVAHTTLWLLVKNSPHGEVYELGTTWVRKDHRGKHINEKMYREFLSRHEDKNIIATTTNPASVKVGERVSLIKVPRKDLPAVVWQASCCCPATKIHTNEVSMCPFAAYEPKNNLNTPMCYFRVNRTYGRHVAL